MTLDELISLEKSATPAPWEYDGMHNEIQTPHDGAYWLIVSECRSAPDQQYDEDRFGHHFDANFALIAAMRNDLPKLIAVAASAQDVVKAHERGERPITAKVKALRMTLDALEATI